MKKLVISTFLLIFSMSMAMADEIEDGFGSLSFNERLMIQTNLMQLGHYHSELDGLWGAGTSSAINSFASGLGRATSDSEAVKSLLVEILFLELNEVGDEQEPGDDQVNENVFSSVSGDVPTKATLSQVRYYTGRKGICVLSLGSFSNGYEQMDVAFWRRYDGWGIDLLSSRNLNPPMFPEVRNNQVLFVNGTSERNGSRWLTRYSSSNTNYFVELVGRNGIALATDQGNSVLQISIPNLTEIVSGFSDCSSIEEQAHWRHFCLETVPTNMRDPIAAPQCRELWQ